MSNRQVTEAHKRAMRATVARLKQEAIDMLPVRMAECGCRRLDGEEFQTRKAELEAADRAAREKRARWL